MQMIPNLSLSYAEQYAVALKELSFHLRMNEEFCFIVLFADRPAEVEKAVKSADLSLAGDRLPITRLQVVAPMHDVHYILTQMRWELLDNPSRTNPFWIEMIEGSEELTSTPH
jgi:hypothetical protein